VTTVLERPGGQAPEKPPAAGTAARRLPGPKVLLPAVVVAWVVGWIFLQGMQTLALPGAQLTSFQRWINDVKNTFDQARDTNSFFKVVGAISDALNWLVEQLQHLISTPPPGRPVPEIGWLGVVAIFVFVAFAIAGVRSAVLVLLGTLAFGFFGYWADSLDTLIVTLLAVAICLVIGIPLGIWMAKSDAFTSVMTPGLDLAQTMPSFAYLIPLALIFGIGPAPAVVVTVVYATPPLIRITAHGLRNVPATTVEASRSLGVKPGQLLRKVELPMARRTIVVGVNQCMMAALSMATIAALVSGPGLGVPVLQSLAALDVGGAAVAGGLIVVLAIMLDRTTTNASERSEVLARAGRRDMRMRRLVLAGFGVVTLVCVFLSHQKVWAAVFPSQPALQKPVADAINTINDAVVNAIQGVTTAFTNIVTYGLINPLQSLLANSPWWLTGLAILAIAAILGGWRAAVTTLVCEGVLLGVGLWNDSMITLTSVLVATILVVLVALVFGVWMGRSRRADTIIRPFLDALQTIPPFVYLVPALALFGTTRFTAIVAALAYGVPIATKLVADGIRGVAPTSVEAAQSSGTSTWQMIRKVQLPMSRSAVVLAANQGLLYVLSMVVIGGLVGGGSLGYFVVAGFSQENLFGKGFAAGIAITALGIMLDRIFRNAAERTARA
jgi:glycine betaine/proline transport system permease protein